MEINFFKKRKAPDHHIPGLVRFSTQQTKSHKPGGLAELRFPISVPARSTRQLTHNGWPQLILYLEVGHASVAVTGFSYW